MKHNKQKGCEGCSVYPCALYKVLPDNKPEFKLIRIEQCPYRNCLVKTMCKDFCKLLLNYCEGFVD